MFWYKSNSELLSRWDIENELVIESALHTV